MKDEGSWIYFLVVIILSIIGSIKKKKNIPGPVSPQEDDEFPSVEFPVYTQEAVSSEPKKKSSVLYEKSVIEKEGEAAFELDAIKGQNDDLLIAREGSLELNFQDAEELRRGVIYSEILNRRYI